MIRSIAQSLTPTPGTLNRDLKLIFLSNFIGAIGDGLFSYVLPNYIRGLGATSADVGFLFSIFILSTALTILPGGIMADRYDRKKVMILGWLIWVPLPLAFSAASHWTQLAPVMALYGFFLSGPATGAYVVTCARKDRIALTYTLMSASWSSGYIFSPGLGGYISALAGMRTVFLLSFALYAAATLVLFFVRGQRAEKPSEMPKKRFSLDSAHARKIILLSSFFAAVFFTLNLVRPLVVQFFQDVYGLSSITVGILGSFAFLGSAIFSIFLGKAGDKFGKVVAVTISLLIGGFSFGLFIAASNVYALGAASFLNGASYMLWPLMGASVGSLTPEASRGKWISLAQMSATLAATFAPYIGGVLYSWSPYVPFYAIIAASPLLALAALATPLRDKPSAKEAVAQQ